MAGANGAMFSCFRPGYVGGVVRLEQPENELDHVEGPASEE
jgi:hypothetical protein